MVLQCIKLCYGCNCNNCSKFEQLFLRVHTHTLIRTLADGAHIIQVELVAHGTGTEPGFEIWVWGSGNWQPGTGNWELGSGSGAQLSRLAVSLHAIVSRRWRPVFWACRFEPLKGLAGSFCSCQLLFIFPVPLFILPWVVVVFFPLFGSPLPQQEARNSGPWITFSCTVLSVA